MKFLQKVVKAKVQNLQNIEGVEIVSQVVTRVQDGGNPLVGQVVRSEKEA